MYIISRITDCPNGFDYVYVDNNQLSASSVYTRNTGDGTIMRYHAPANGKLYNVMNAGNVPFSPIL